MLLDTPIAALVITLLVYVRCFRNAFVYDDHLLVELNPYIGHWAMVWRSFVTDAWWFHNPRDLPQSAYYRPLQNVWAAANYHLFGIAPPGWHFTSIAVHLIAVWLVFQIARELTRSRWTPIIAATLFGVLPIHAEAVVWPAAIAIPVCAVLQLAAFLVFIRGECRECPRQVLPLLFYALALLTHESAAVFPLIAVAYVVLLTPSTRDEEDRNAAREAWSARILRTGVTTLPFFIELAVYLAIRFWALGFISRANVANSMTSAQQWLTTPSVLGIYATLLAAPWRAGPAHSVNLVSAMTEREFYLPVLVFAVAAGLAAVALWNGRRRNFYLFCVAWIAVSLAPVMNLSTFARFDLVHDRYLYMASVAWCLVVAELAVSFLTAAEPSGRLLAVTTAVVTVVCATILFHVEGFWHDNIALFTAWAEMAPDCDLCHGRLGLALKQAGDNAGAEREFEVAEKIAPNQATHFYNMGLLHVQMGRAEEGLGEVKHALAMSPDAPARAYVEYAKLADSAGKTDEREDALRHAETLPGGLEVAELGRAQMMISHRDFTGAERSLRATIARDPANPQWWTLLGASLVGEGRAGEALAAYKQSLKLKPDPSVQKTVAQMEAGQHKL